MQEPDSGGDGSGEQPPRKVVDGGIAVSDKVGDRLGDPEEWLVLQAAVLKGPDIRIPWAGAETEGICRAEGAASPAG